MTNQSFNVIQTPGRSFSDSEVFSGRHFINGTWVNSENGETFERRDPARGHVISISQKGSEIETEAAIKAARESFDSGVWADLSGKERGVFLNKVADLIAGRLDELALFETLESGKPISQARAEMEGVVDLWRYAATAARVVHGESHNALGSEMLGMVLKEPVGVVSLITPWNFPLLIISQKLPFALAAGCSAIVKPSEMTPTTTVKLFEMLEEAGLPKGVANLVLGLGQPVGSMMSTHKSVDMVSFTGSTAVGKHIVKASADTLKKTSLELGGKNPQVIFPDCDLDKAADAAIFGIYFNAGECCNSSSRVLVHEDVKDQVIEKLVSLSRAVTVGTPTDERTKIGALISVDHANKVHAFVEGAKAQGATIACGGAPLNVEGQDGQFYEPTIITDVTSDMDVAQAEVFGPVLSVLTFKTVDEAIALANDSVYGLSAGLWSNDIHTCLKFARKAQAGTVWVNTWMDGFAELPFGGYKESGLGRELGHYGLEEFLETKTVQMRIGNTRQNWVD